MAQVNLAILFQHGNKLDEAPATCEEVYATFEALGVRQQMAEALVHKLGIEAYVAVTLHQQGPIYDASARVAGTDDETADFRRQAFERFQESLAIERRTGNEAGAADSLGELGKLLRDAGQMRKAIEAFTEVLEISRRLGNPVKVGITLGMLGHIHERQGQYAAALEKYEETLGLLRQYGSPQQIAVEERYIARVHGKLGNGRGGGRGVWTTKPLDHEAAKGRDPNTPRSSVSTRNRRCFCRA